MKNKKIVWIVAIATLCQFGFDWGVGPKNDQKGGQTDSAAQSSAALQKAANLPFSQMMGLLSQNLTLWPALSSENKQRSVEAILMVYRDRQNVAILRPAAFYVVQVTQSLAANPSLQSTDLMSLIRVLAVMEYDFYNGQDKDALAKEVLGEKTASSIREMRKTSAK